MQFLRVARHTFSISNRKYFAQLEETLTDDPDLGGRIESDSEDDDEVKIPFHFNFHRQLLSTNFCSGSGS